ncbi:MAG: hypothetical protein KJO95_02615 [Gammaproteobacteria bacterium]|nr:hypothetical protein [Gammaproteobacteria bacterium]MBU2675970.1 hypothetical protein [Gammaproteobacteria bacterium]NNC58186.1 hypothetical protein [Woeseiaceae bacterium]NNL49706.1 hypothetical protein [Woeseiaceae bacterium]
MFEKAKPARDAFTFSLDGMKTISSFTFAPAIADDRINKIPDEQAKQVRDSAVLKPRLWQRLRRQLA